jgi:DNA-binding response OmpR family regulator
MAAMRVLLIEDDRKAAKLLAKGLQEEGFVVDVAAPARTARSRRR